MGGSNVNRMQKNMINFKIIKCKNWEKDGTCKYGIHCTFAHGDKELRSKDANYLQMNTPMMMMPMIYDMNSMPMLQMQQMMMAGGANQNPYMMMMPPNQESMNNNNDNDNQNPEVKDENTQQ